MLATNIIIRTPSPAGTIASPRANHEVEGAVTVLCRSTTIAPRYGQYDLPWMLFDKYIESTCKSCFETSYQR